MFLAGFLLLSSCAEAADTAGIPPTYRGTVVDGKTGAPIEGAVIVIEWEKCGLAHMDGCGIHHTVRETVTDSRGAFSIDPMPETDWDPFYVLERLWVLIYAVDYLPLGTVSRNKLPGLEGLLDSELQKGLAIARISLLRAESDSDLRRGDLYPAWMLGVDTRSALPQLSHAVEEQKRRIRERAQGRRGPGEHSR